MVSEQGGDPTEGEPKLPVEEDLTQPVDIVGGVLPVPGTRAGGWREQADLAVVVQRPDRHTGEPGQLTNGIQSRQRASIS